MPSPNTTRRVLLAARPEGMPKEADFRMDEAPVPECPENGLVVRTLWISVDPYLRGRISGRRSYVDPIPVDGVMEGGAVGEVVSTRHLSFREGDLVAGMWKWQDIAVAADSVWLRKLDPAEGPLTAALGVLGLTGLTAYFGLMELCAPKLGETVVVSAAAGAVGSVAGQIAKILGCFVVGTAGSQQKVDYVKSLGFDDALDYRSGEPYRDALARMCPKGIDCYFDNVGGALTDAVFELMNPLGRVAVCGQISQYNDPAGDIGPRQFGRMIVKQLRVEGFLVFRWVNRFAEARERMSVWLREGRLRSRETIYDGLESAPRAFIGLFTGDNVGKALVRL